MHKVRRPILWFDKTFEKKEDFQFILFAVFIALIIITKCYMLIYPQANVKPTINSELQQPKMDPDKINITPSAVIFVK